MANKIIDTHAHMLKEIYEDDLDSKIISNLKELDYIFNVSWNINTSKEVIELNKIYENLLPVIGIHPNNVKDNSLIESKNKLREMLINYKDKIVAIGEIGIDLFRTSEDYELQVEFFKMQIELAIEFNKPIILHIRNAYKEASKILENYSGLKLLLHSWTGTKEDLGFFNYVAKMNNLIYGINGIITFKNADSIRESFEMISKGNFLIETDSPWLAPAPFRSKKNEPKNVVIVLEYIANYLKINQAELQQKIYSKTKEFFNV